MTTIVATLRQVHGFTKASDKAWLASLFIVAGLAVFDRSQAVTTVQFTLAALMGVAPWLLLSVAIAASAAATGADHLIARAFQGRMATMVILAALMGALSPFCSCGVIPLIAALLAMGVPLAPVMAFWLASPVMDPAMFALTAGTLGLDFALAKTLAAISLGLLGGFGTAWIARSGLLADPLRPGIGNGGCGGARIRSPKPPVWAFWREAERRQKFGREAAKAALFLGKWLTLAFILESLMLAFLPGERVVALVGGDGVGPILLATLVGVPAYLNGYAALPLVAGLLGKGMSAGAGLAFLVAGGVSSIPAAIAVWALVKRSVFALYLGFALVGSFAAGLIFQAVQ
ncbi:MAG: permease [Rhodospirillales bacterium]|nr:permease [Rhodospirillales bacterium]